MSRVRVEAVMCCLVVVVAAVAVGCSSGDGKGTSPVASATTDSPSVPNDTVRATSAFFAGIGGSVLSFERASQPLMTGTKPARSLCDRFVREVQQFSGDPAKLVALVGRIPDPVLRSAVRGDVSNKLFLVQACVSSTGLNDSPDEQRVFQLFRSHSEAVVAALARDGVRL